MNITGNHQQRNLSTADLVAAAERRESEQIEDEEDLQEMVATDPAATAPQMSDLAPLFDQASAADFRNRWGVVQQGFVDDPEQAVRAGDELVAQVIKSLAETFARQRAALEGPQGSTEELRQALRRYRSFFERLLSI
jgi:hypothetical protein